MMTKTYRHEQKYYINQATYVDLRTKLQAALSLDKHTKHESWYRIRSVYFDSFDEECLEDKLSGVQSRKKYRIRIYNNQDSFISFEIKSKEGEYIHKHAVRISRAHADDIIAGTYGSLLTYNDKELEKAFHAYGIILTT